MNADISRESASVRRWQTWSLTVGAAAAVVCVLGGFFLDPAQCFRAYLAAYLFVLAIALGGMAILMIYHLTGGAWGFLVRRILEAQAGTLPLLALLFVPLGFGVEALYLWAQPDMVAADERLRHQQFWLNKDFFLLRTAVYFLIWLATAFWLRMLSRRQDRTGDSRLPWKLQRLSEVGLVLFGTTIHFAAFDWVETLQSNFHSTIFPMLVAASQLLAAQSFALIILAVYALRRETATALSSRALNDLGNLLLAFLIIWAYMAWFQYMLIWIANMRADVLWMLPRLSGGWLWITRVLTVFGFVVPFAALLSRLIKIRPQLLARVAALVLFMQLVFNYWQILPSFSASGASDHWMDFVTPFAVGGLWLAYFLFQLERLPLLPVHDPSRTSAMHLRRLDQEDVTIDKALVHG